MIFIGETLQRRSLEELSSNDVLDRKFEIRLGRRAAPGGVNIPR